MIGNILLMIGNVSAVFSSADHSYTSVNTVYFTYTVLKLNKYLFCTVYTIHFRFRYPQGDDIRV